MTHGSRNLLSSLGRRRLLGLLLVAGGAVLSGCGLRSAGEKPRARGRILARGGGASIPAGLEVTLQFPLLEAIYGRRSRRFFRGA